MCVPPTLMVSASEAPNKNWWFLAKSDGGIAGSPQQAPFKMIHHLRIFHRYLTPLLQHTIALKLMKFVIVHFGGPYSNSYASRYLRSPPCPPSTCRPMWVNAKPGRAMAPRRVHRPPRRSRDHDGSSQGFPYLKRISDLHACSNGLFPFRRFWWYWHQQGKGPTWPTCGVFTFGLRWNYISKLPICIG